MIGILAGAEQVLGSGAPPIANISAASENSAITLALSCYFLAAEPQYHSQLRDALDQAFPDPLGPISQSAVAAIPLIDGVLSEALRLGTHFLLPRVTPAEGVEVDGVHIPGDTLVGIASYSIQTSPEHFYPDPMVSNISSGLFCKVHEFIARDRTFDRSAGFRTVSVQTPRRTERRWRPSPMVRALLAASSCPPIHTACATGQHACLGKTLAYQKMRYVLARLVLAYDMHFKPGFDVHAFREGILNKGTPHLEVPLHMSFQRRPGVHFDDLGDRE